MRNPKTLGLLRGSKITLEAHIKMNTPIPFCQFEGSPCKEACHVLVVLYLSRPGKLGLPTSLLNHWRRASPLFRLKKDRMHSVKRIVVNDTNSMHGISSSAW